MQHLNDYERLLLAQTKVWGTTNSPGLIKELDRLIASHKWWGLAYAVRGEAKAALAAQTRDAGTVRDATEDVDKGYRLLPDSPVVIAAALLVHNMSIELARLEGQEASLVADSKAKAAHYAAELAAWPDYVLGCQRRVYYFKLIGDERASEEVDRNLVRIGAGGPRLDMVDIVLSDDPTRISSFQRQHGNSLDGKCILAMHYAVGGRASAGAKILCPFG